MTAKTNPINKYYISADQLLHDSVQLALDIAQSGWRPDLIVGIWRGGAPVGVTVQEVLEFIGIDADHLAIRTSSYTGIGSRTRVEIQGLDLLVARLNPGTRLLLVDDVFDTGLSLHHLQLELHARCPAPPDIRTAVPYYKPVNNRTARAPDYFVHTTADWLVFPHELMGLSDEELLRRKPGFDELAPRLLALRDNLRKPA